LKALLADVDGIPSALALEAELDAFADHWNAAEISSALRTFFGSRANDA
jgi:hypothetical protein